MRRIIIVGIVVFALVTAGVVILVLRAGTAGGAQTTELNVRRARVEPGDIVITVSAAGSVEPEQTASLYFPSTAVGVVGDLRVDIGQRVSEGDILARLDAAGLRIAHEQAVLSQDIQELRNDQTAAGPSEYDVAGPQAEVAAAATRYSDIAEPDPEALEIARLEAQQAEHSFNAAQMNMNGLQARTSTAVGDNAHANAGIAWVQAEIARLQYEQMKAGPKPEDLAVASAEVGLAAAQLDQVEAGASEFDLERGQIQLEREEIAVELAVEALGDATLLAPFDGVISVVNLHEGTPPPAAEPALELIDDSVFHIDVEVDEIDIGEVEVGQPVFVELDALPGRDLTGTVTSISPAASTDGGGVVSYVVRVDLDPTSAPLRSGMTATVDIAVEQVESVLRVPNWAVRIDRRTGDTFVNVLGPDGGLVEIQVQLGLRGDTYSEVVSGLEQGQEVLVNLEREGLSLGGGE